MIDLTILNNKIKIVLELEIIGDLLSPLQTDMSCNW